MEKKKMAKGVLTKIREKPGQSNAYKYDTEEYAGPEHTFPINTLPRARNALARAHFAKNPQRIKSKVYKKFPSLLKRKKMRDEDEL